MTDKMLPQVLREEIDKCVELRNVYLELPGNIGAYGAAMIAQYIEAGREALDEHDAVKMVSALLDLRGCA